jgi:hypothetical protein
MLINECRGIKMNNLTKKSSIYLSLNIQHTPSKNPAFVVRLNGVDQNSTNTQDQTYEYSMNGIFGPNLLTIEFTNKQPSDTQTDMHGNIIHDLTVELNQLLVDQFDVTTIMKQRGTYITCDGKQEHTNGFMHKNGVLTLNFICPGFYFLKKIKFI